MAHILNQLKLFSTRTPYHEKDVAKGFIKGGALILLETNSSGTLFEENNSQFHVVITQMRLPIQLCRKDTFISQFYKEKMCATGKKGCQISRRNYSSANGISSGKTSPHIEVTYLHNIGAGEKLNAMRLHERKRHSVQWDEWSRLVWAIIS